MAIRCSGKPVALRPRKENPPPNVGYLPVAEPLHFTTCLPLATTPRDCDRVLRHLGSCVRRRGLIPPTLLASFPGPIPSRAFIHPSSSHLSQFAPKPVQVASKFNNSLIVVRE
jgi:hypothetical protein